ncbi:MAG TPA: 30S ribosomal protein S17 [Bacteroidetes bacterium]|nr:30S ribosomal protein S17 [Bacteroidota bacterium]
MSEDTKDETAEKPEVNSVSESSAENTQNIKEKAPASVNGSAEKKKTSHSGIRKTRIVKVLSNKMDKTIIVSEEKKIKHPIYKKFYKKTTKFAAHDPGNSCDIGDKVKIMETRPLSKTKRWRLVEIIEKVK